METYKLYVTKFGNSFFLNNVLTLLKYYITAHPNVTKDYFLFIKPKVLVFSFKFLIGSTGSYRLKERIVIENMAVVYTTEELK